MAKKPSKREIKSSKKRITMARVKKTAGKTADLIDNQIILDRELLDDAIKNIEKRMITRVKDLKTSDMGLLMGPRVNLKQLQTIHTELIKVWELEYGAGTRKIVKGYFRVATWITDNLDDLGLAGEMTSIDIDVIKALQAQSALDFAVIGEQGKRRVLEALYNSVITQTPYPTLIKEIQGALSGRVDVRGRPLAEYAELYANDAMQNFYNSVHIEKARSIGIRHLLYVGNVMGTTRDFCRKRAGKVYTIAQINSWDHKWKGKRGPALTYRGGWNCRHSWQGVMKEWLEP